MIKVLLVLCLVVLPLPSSCTPYGITCLGKDRYIASMNNYGQVLGDVKLADGSRQAFIYQNGVTTNIPLYNGATLDVADINDSGAVVGTMIHEAPDGMCPRYTAFVWKADKGFTDLGALTQDGLSSAVAINNNGSVIGESTDLMGSKAFIWNEVGGMQAIPTFGGDYGDAYDIDNNGRVLGSAGNINALWVPFLYDGSALINLTALGMPGAGICMNDYGQIAGVWHDPWSRSFIWSSTEGMQTIEFGSFGPNYYCKNITDINNSGQVIGSYYNWSTSVVGTFLYSDKQVIRLEDLLPVNSGWTQLAAVCINDHGQIAGYGMMNGEYQSFVMSPVPEPSSILCIASGLALFALVGIGTRVRVAAR